MDRATIMLKHGAEFRRCLVELDVKGVMALWAHLAPKEWQCRTEAEALASLHLARTAAESVPLKARLYSHSWLAERGHRSLLPGNLRPKGDNRR
jgi:hypothetical protein